MIDFTSVRYRCKECRKDFGDPASIPNFMVWYQIVLMHVYDECKLRVKEVNQALEARYI